jgi:hypothetical protein
MGSVWDPTDLVAASPGRCGSGARAGCRRLGRGGGIRVRSRFASKIFRHRSAPTSPCWAFTSRRHTRPARGTGIGSCVERGSAGAVIGWCPRSAMAACGSRVNQPLVGAPGLAVHDGLGQESVESGSHPAPKFVDAVFLEGREWSPRARPPVRRRLGEGVASGPLR